MVLKLLYPLLSGEADSDSDNQDGLPVTTKLNEASSDSKESKEVEREDGEYTPGDILPLHFMTSWPSNVYNYHRGHLSG